MILILLSTPRLWGYGIYTVMSGSMEPAIHVGDVIYIREVPFEELQVGDVITYRAQEGTAVVTHRVSAIQKEAQLLQTKGDANDMEDAVWIRADAVLGRVEYSVRALGYAAQAAGTLGGKLFLLAVFLWMAAARIALAGLRLLAKGKENYVYQKENG